MATPSARNSSVTREQRYTRDRPCPVCGGHDRMERGKGQRCNGYASGDYFYCKQVESPHEGPNGTFRHYLAGACDCGAPHGASEHRRPRYTGPTPNSGSSHARAERVTDYAICNPSAEVVKIHRRHDFINEKGEPDKRFTWHQPDGSSGLGGLPVAALPLYGCEKLAQAPPDAEVIVVEGEKARKALCDAGILSLATVTGASGTPGDAALEPLRRFRVVLWPDNDPDVDEHGKPHRKGQRHMARIAAALVRVGMPTPRVVDWPDAPEHGDAADYLAQHPPEELRELLAAAPAWRLADGEAQNDGEKPPAGAVLVRLADVEPEPISWLWQDRIPFGKLTIIAGDPGLGKSFITLEVAARLSTGTPWPGGGGRPEKGDVIIMTAEDGLADTVRPRLDAMHADVTRIHALTGVPCESGERSFRLTEDISKLEAAIQSTGAKLVILDPLNAYLAGVDSHKAAEVRSVLAPLAAMAERTGVAVLVVHHLNKGNAANALYRPGGSLDFIAAARSVLGVAPDPDHEGRRVLLSLKLNLAPLPPGIGYRLIELRVQWDQDPVTITAAEAFNAPGADERGERADAQEFLRQVLARGAVQAETIFAEARKGGIAEKTLKRAKKDLAILSDRRGGLGQEGAWWWSLPPKGVTDPLRGPAKNVTPLDENGPLSALPPPEPSEAEPVMGEAYNRATGQLVPTPEPAWVRGEGAADPLPDAGVSQDEWEPDTWLFT